MAKEKIVTDERLLALLIEHGSVTRVAKIAGLSRNAIYMRLRQNEDFRTKYEEAKNAVLQEKSDFVDAHVVFVEDDGTKYYHTYECSRFAKQGYWIFGRNTAEAKGYTACPYCH